MFNFTHDSNAHVHEKFTAIALTKKFCPHLTQVLLARKSLREKGQYPVNQGIEVRCKVYLLEVREKIGHIMTQKPMQLDLRDCKR